MPPKLKLVPISEEFILAEMMSNNVIDFVSFLEVDSVDDPPATGELAQFRITEDRTMCIWGPDEEEWVDFANNPTQIMEQLDGFYRLEKEET